MKWNVSVLRRSGECERTEVADFELSEFFNRIASAEGKAWVLSVERVGDVGDSALVEPDGDELVSQLGKRRWRVMGDPEDGWWVEVETPKLVPAAGSNLARPCAHAVTVEGLGMCAQPLALAVDERQLKANHID
jgi:hypothetical protein